MADRDLYARGDALHHVLAGLQREVRTLKSRAGRPGAVRSDVKDPMGLAGASNQAVVTLNEVHLDPGLWVVLARGEINIDAAVYTAKEAVTARITVIPSAGATFQLATAATSPMAMPAVLGAGRWFAASWSMFGVHQADTEFSVLQEAWCGDWIGSVHAVTWNRSAVIALPM